MVVADMQAHDDDEGANSQLSYELANEGAAVVKSVGEPLFAIGKNSGIVRATRRLTKVKAASNRECLFKKHDHFSF